jgi:Zn-dependent protease/CBS domain-containing protein
MFGQAVTLFQLFGFRVRVDLSWILLAALVAWSLATGYFPGIAPGQSVETYWSMGVAGVIMLMFSLVFHELSHSLVARHYGLPIGGITLFVFGGVAEMEGEPVSPKAEFLMAIAGPLASFFLAAIAFGLASWGDGGAFPTTVTAVLHYAALLNVVLGTFNLIPAFPLDGGRMLRAALWHFKGSSRAATRIAARIGGYFGFALIAIGILNAFQGDVVGGLWMGLIGLFLRGAANASLMQSAVTRGLQGERIERFMTPNPSTVPPSITLRELVDRYIYRDRHEAYPVVDEGGRLAGIVTVHDVRAQPREEWDFTTVGQVATEPGPDNTIDAGADATRALALMQKGQLGRLMVTRDGRIVGIVALKDMMRLFALRMDLEGDAPDRPSR